MVFSKEYAKEHESCLSMALLPRGRYWRIVTLFALHVAFFGAKGDVLECDPPCLHHAAQIFNGSECRCFCQPPVGNAFYIGNQCETPAVLCPNTTSYCANGGQCQVSGACSCSPPFYGPNCESTGLVCGEVLCQGRAACEESYTGRGEKKFQCGCEPGWEGASCDRPIAVPSNSSATLTPPAPPTSGAATPVPSELPPGEGAAADLKGGGDTTKVPNNALFKPSSDGDGNRWIKVAFGVVGGLLGGCVLLALLVFTVRRYVSGRRRSKFQELIEAEGSDVFLESASSQAQL